MSQKEFQRLQIRFMWACLVSLLRLSAGMTVPLAVQDIELEFRALKDKR